MEYSFDSIFALSDKYNKEFGCDLFGFGYCACLGIALIASYQVLIEVIHTICDHIFVMSNLNNDILYFVHSLSHVDTHLRFLMYNTHTCLLYIELDRLYLLAKFPNYP